MTNFIYFSIILYLINAVKNYNCLHITPKHNIFYFSGLWFSSIDILKNILVNIASIFRFTRNVIKFWFASMNWTSAHMLHWCSLSLCCTDMRCKVLYFILSEYVLEIKSKIYSLNKPRSCLNRVLTLKLPFVFGTFFYFISSNCRLVMFFSRYDQAIL